MRARAPSASKQASSSRPCPRFWRASSAFRQPSQQKGRYRHTTVKQATRDRSTTVKLEQVRPLTWLTTRCPSTVMAVLASPPPSKRYPNPARPTTVISAGIQQVTSCRVTCQPTHLIELLQFLYVHRVQEIPRKSAQQQIRLQRSPLPRLVDQSRPQRLFSLTRSVQWCWQRPFFFRWVIVNGP